MQAGCAGAVKRNAAEEDDATDGIVGLADAGAGEIVVDEALRAETAEQALDDAVFEVDVHHALIDVGGGLEDDRADGARCAPLVEILIFWLRRAKGVHRAEPCAAVNLRESPSVGAALSAAGSC